MAVRGIRGATTARENTAEAIREAALELLQALAEANGLDAADVASVLFSVTPDLDAAFPAQAARAMGWNEVALLDVQAPKVKDDVARCIRVLIHWNTDRPVSEVRHSYLRQARHLRPDRGQGD